MAALRALRDFRVTLEGKLEREYVKLYTSYMGLPRDDASKLVRSMLARAKTELASAAGQTPSVNGHQLLAAEKTNLRVRAELAERRADGVTDQDILWWHNMPDLERGMLLQDDLYHYVAFSYIKIGEGHTEDEAERLLPKYFPLYHAPDNTLSGPDRPLPVELKDRINRYTMAQAKDMPGFRRRKEQYSSFNALVREEIVAGNL